MTMIDIDPDSDYYDDYPEYDEEDEEYDEEDLYGGDDGIDGPIERVESAIENIIGSSHPADVLGAVGAFAQEMSIENKGTPAQKEPISGKDYKTTALDGFKKARKNLSPFEDYVQAHMSGRGEDYKYSVESSIDSLYRDLFGADIRDFYQCLKGMGYIGKIPESKSFVNLHALKTIANRAIETSEYKFTSLIYLLVSEKFDFQKELAE